MSDRAEPPASVPDPTVTQVGNPALAAWEIASVVCSVAIAQWMVAAAAGYNKAIIAIPVVLATSLMFASHRVRRESLRDVGFRFDNFLGALYFLASPLAVVAAVCLLIAWMSGTEISFLRWHQSRNLGLQLGLHFLWALAQQYVLQGFLNRRAMLATGRSWLAILIVATIFGLLHLPNPWMVLLTFIGGVVWAAVYQRAPNLFALALTHSVVTWLILSTLPPSLLNHMRVGIGYFN